MTPSLKTSLSGPPPTNTTHTSVFSTPSKHSSLNKRTIMLFIIIINIICSLDYGIITPREPFYFVI